MSNFSLSGDKVDSNGTTALVDNEQNNANHKSKHSAKQSDGVKQGNSNITFGTHQSSRVSINSDNDPTMNNPRNNLLTKRLHKLNE